MKTTDEKTIRLKNRILSEYRSIRQFAAETDIPYSTLVTALDRGIDGMAYMTVLKICGALRLNPVDFRPLGEGGELSEEIACSNMEALFLRLNETGRSRAMEFLGDLTSIDKYTI